MVRYPASVPSAQNQVVPSEWYSRPEWVLVIVGIGTALVVGWQSSETRRAANAALASIRLQETPLVQWTTTNNWYAFKSVRDNGDKEVCVSFKVCNPTKFPLIIERTEMGCRGTIYSSSERASLPPEDTYPMALTSELTEEDYALETLVVPLRATVWFTDILKRPQKQTFGGFVKIDKDGNTTFDPQHWWVQAYEKLEE